MSQAMRCRSKGRRPWSDLLADEIDRPEQSIKTVAAAMGYVNESSLRGHLTRDRSPDVDWIIAHRERLSDGMLIGLLEQIGGDRAAVTLLDRSDLPSAVRVAHLREAQLRIEAAMQELRERSHEAFADNLVTVDEKARLFNGHLRLGQALHLWHRLMHACPGLRRVE